MADGNTEPGGRYLGADGRLHDAHGKPLDAGDPDAEAKAEQERVAAPKKSAKK